MKVLLVLLIISVFTACVFGILSCMRQNAKAAGDMWQIKVIAEYPHDPTAFTQGLTVHEGRMYEGTGLYGHSSLRLVDINTGEIDRVAPLDNAYFGEGITVFENRIYQLTWRNNTVIVYDTDNLNILKTLAYDGEAWGLTNDGTHLILSDGSAVIRFLDPESLNVVKKITVKEGGGKVRRLNELEYIQGEIWANIWYKDRIARISPADGGILGWIDLSELYPRSKRNREEVLNGIAFDASASRIFVTGKNWPKLYEVEVVRP